MSIRFSLMFFYTLTYTKNIYDKRDDFKFLIVNFLFICSHIPAAPAYKVYISKLIRYSWDSHHDVRDRRLRLIMNILTKGFLLVKLNASSRKFYSRHHVLVNRYRIYVLHMTSELFRSYYSQSLPFLIHDLSPTNTTGVTNSTGTNLPFRGTWVYTGF